MAFLVCLVIFLAICLKEASQPTLPPGYHNNWKLEREDADKVRFGEMSKAEFNRNINNGKYR